jgi:hypothetical protein
MWFCVKSVVGCERQKIVLGWLERMRSLLC